jgi:hypothetical protein
MVMKKKMMNALYEKEVTVKKLIGNLKSAGFSSCHREANTIYVFQESQEMYEVVLNSERKRVEVEYVLFADEKLIEITRHAIKYCQGNDWWGFSCVDMNGMFPIGCAVNYGGGLIVEHVIDALRRLEKVRNEIRRFISYHVHHSVSPVSLH